MKINQENSSKTTENISSVIKQENSSQNKNELDVLIKDPKWSGKKFNFKSIGSDALREMAIKKFNTYEEAMDIIDSKFFVSQLGCKSFVYAEPKNVNDDLIAFSHNEFLNHYGHKQLLKLLEIKDGIPVLKQISVFREWKQHGNRRQYNRGIKFYPGILPENETKNYYNSWRGFPVKGEEGKFPKIEYHLKHIWCRDNIEHYNYLMAWFADIIQNPAEKKNVALVVKGGKGWGKSIIFEELLVNIFGYTYIKIDKAEQVTGKFNQHLQGRLLLVLEEAIWAGDKNAEGALKSMISDTQFVIEGKGVNAEKSEAYFRLAFVSNEKQAVPATTDERRFFALKLSNEVDGNLPYFKDLIHEIRNGGLEAFMYHIENLDISKISLRQAPRTEALFEDILAKMETVERFLYDLLHEDTVQLDHCKGYVPLWNNKVTKASLFQYFQQWIKECMSSNIYLPKHDISTQTALTREINKILPFKDTKFMGKNAYEFPSKEIGRRMFQEKVKSDIVWFEDESDKINDEEFEAIEREMSQIFASEPALSQ